MYIFFQKKHIPMPSSSKPKYETGTSNHEDVDLDWLPKEGSKYYMKQLSNAHFFYLK